MGVRSLVKTWRTDVEHMEQYDALLLLTSVGIYASFQYNSECSVLVNWLITTRYLSAKRTHDQY